MEPQADTLHLATLLRAVADPQRLALLKEMAAGPRTVGELVQGSELAQASVSHHLAILRKAGLIEAVREGRHQHHAWAEPEPGTADAALLVLLRSWLGANATGGRRPSAIGNRRPDSAYPLPRSPLLEDHLL